MKQAVPYQLRAEFWRAAGPTIACAGILVGILVLVPAISAASHAFSRMDSQRRGEHLSVLDMTQTEKDAIMTKHHIELLASLHTQYSALNALKRKTEDAEATHPSSAGEQATRLQETKLGYLFRNYDGIARQTPADALAHARLPRELP